MTLTQITEKGIKDGEIINADISSNTADRIAGTKIDPSFTSNIYITNDAPKLFLTDSSNNPDFTIQNANGAFVIQDETASAVRMEISDIGHTTISGNVTVSNGYLEVSNPNLYINENITHAGDGNTRIRFPANDAISLETAGSSGLYIDSTGNIGLNITTPQSLLELSAANDAVIGIQLGRAGSAITASRYIGICQTNNATNLGVNSGFSGVEFGGPSSTDEAYLGFHTHDAGVGSGERVRISKSGALGIGTISPQANIDIVDTNPMVLIRPTDGNAGKARLYMGGGGADQDKCAIIFDPANGFCRGSLKFCLDNTADTSNADESDAKLNLHPDGEVEIVAGNLKFASGYGLNFSAYAADTGNPYTNTLHDYEEGQWTPAVSQGIDNGSGGAPTYDVNTGNYVKIGRFVNVTYFIRMNTSSGNVYGTDARLHLTGLPFTIQAIANNHNGFGSTVYHTLETNVGAVPIMHYGAQNGTDIECYYGPHSAAPSNNVDQAGKYIIGGFSYHTNA